MERVQFEQEQMLPELKDLVEKKLFTVKETKLILQRRTELERTLIRRIPHKSDFLRYIDYERELELLRRKRVKRIIGDTKGPATVSDYAMVQRQFNIFERALKKFKDDIALWIQYIELAKKEGARTLVGRVCARAIQLHPNTPSLYILAASHEWHHGSVSAARTLLQRGLRLNKNSVDLWREYVKLELGFVENLRRRWDVLGIKNHTQEDIDPDLEARKDVLDGAIVKSVMDNAFQAVPTIELFQSLEKVLTPSGAHLLSHLYWLLEKTLLPNSAQALGLILRRTVRHDLDPEEMVQAIPLATQQIIKCTTDCSLDRRPEIIQAVSAFTEEWSNNESLDENLREYLSCSVAKIILYH